MLEPPDYASLIDHEIWSFIKRTEKHFPADAVGCSTDELRDIYSVLCRDFFNGYPVGVTSADATVPSQDHQVAVRRYSANSDHTHAHIIYIHGGGYVLGDLESHDDVCAELCAHTNMGLTSIDYRLSPEHKHPAAYNDCLAVVLFEAQRLGQALLLCGDSAGGNLCAAVAHGLRAKNASKLIKAQVLIYPELGGDKNAGSYRLHANAPMLTLADVHYYQEIRVAEALPENDASFAPLLDTDFSDLPQTLVLSAECDPLADDGKHYCNAIKRAGGVAEWRNEPGLVHGYLRARHQSQKARQSFDYIIESLKRFADTV